MSKVLATILFSLCISSIAQARLFRCVVSLFNIGTKQNTSLLVSDPRPLSKDQKELSLNLQKHPPDQLNIFDVPELKDQFLLFEKWMYQETNPYRSRWGLSIENKEKRKTISEVLAIIKNAKKTGFLSYKDSLPLITKALVATHSLKEREKITYFIAPGVFRLNPKKKYFFLFQDELVSEYDLLKHQLNGIEILQVPFKSVTKVHDRNMSPAEVALHDLVHGAEVPEAYAVPNPKFKGLPDNEAILNLLERAKNIPDKELSAKVITCLFYLVHEQITYSSSTAESKNYLVSHNIAEWKWLFSYQEDVKGPNSMEKMLLKNLKDEKYLDAIHWLRDNL